MRIQRARRRAGWLGGLSSLVALAWLGSAAAESGAYRVELLVFRYTDSSQQPVESASLDDYRRAWRLDGPRVMYIPEDPAPLGVMSDRMRAAWRRLEVNQGYEPLVFANWEQSRIDYHPPVRIHDEELMLERLELPDAAVHLDLRSPDMFAPYRHAYYRLDGAAQLRRTRFLHLDIDLEIRVELVQQEVAEAGATKAPAFAPGAPVATLPPAALEAPVEPGLEGPAYWSAQEELPPLEPQARQPPPGALVHRLRESRQIRTDDLLYFDSPYLGVLARVTATTGE